MHDLYRNELRRWLNLLQPSAQLIQRVGVGCQRRRYDLPRTPRDRLAGGATDDPALAQPVDTLRKLREGLDRFELSRQMDRKLQRIYAHAHTRSRRRVSPSGKTRGVTF